MKQVSAPVTVETLTDADIQAERDGIYGIENEAYRELCVVALQVGEPTGKRPWCRVCGWRKGGVDSWDGARCKCKLSAPEYYRCLRCAGLGRVPYDLGTQPCPSCDGSGLVDPADRLAARARIVATINARREAKP